MSSFEKEKASGKTRAGRDELDAILEFIRAGDEFVVVKLDRLGRSTSHVLNLVRELERKGAGLRALEPEFCTSTDTCQTTPCARLRPASFSSLSRIV